ncbi:concanavalin A-like lectin/glucanase domain-containing protein [Dissophora ornata]|nr:concanavalin A-like lectin/glucanase domain-containing protein [Dissophora ornata]
MEFIAGLHLVNCKVMGYELPTDLPDELMLSAAAVGRIRVPPRPAQGPSTILAGYVEPAVTAVERPVIPKPIPTSTSNEQAYSMGNSVGVDFMNAYNVSLPETEAPIPPPTLVREELNFDNPDTHATYPYQQYQQPLMRMPSPMQEQFIPQQYQPVPQHQPMHQYQPMPQPIHHYQPLFEDRASPVPAPRPAAMFSAKSHSSSTTPVPSLEETHSEPSKPGPHALHDLAEDAPVVLSMDNASSIGRNKAPVLKTTLAVPSRVESPSISLQSSPSNSGLVNLTTEPVPAFAPPRTNPFGISSAVQNYYSIDNLDLYVSSPDAWDHDAAPSELDVEGNYIKYRSDYKNDVSASVTANHPINPNCGLFYFEITVDQFKGSAISVGIASKSLRKNCQVGWDLNSWGFHGDDGRLYFGNGEQSMEYSSNTYKQEDVVGCGVNFIDRSIFFTLNGYMEGVAFRFIKDTIPLYPAIGLSHAGTEINANFGDQTFWFDIVDYKKKVMSKPAQSQPLVTWNNGTWNKKVFQVLDDGLSVIANSNGTGCIRGPKISPRDRDVFYFEITILYMPVTELGSIAIGICGRSQSMTEPLGWKEDSYGYSGELGDFLSLSSNRSSLNARSKSGKMKARARGPQYRAGSVVGCGVDFASRELFFTLNGECLGQAFCEVDVLHCYPCVSVIDGGVGGIGGPLSLMREHQPGTGGVAGTSPLNSASSRNGLASGGSTTEKSIAFEFKANFGQYAFMFDLPAFEASEGL